MQEWFKTKIKYLKQNEDGSVSSKTEEHLVNALSFTEAESKLQYIMEGFISEYNLLDCSKLNIQDVVIDEAFDKFYNVKVQFVSINESGKQKKITEVYIVQAGSLVGANEKMEERMKGSIVDWNIIAISETKFVDAYPYIESKEVQEEDEPFQEEDNADVNEAEALNS